MLLLIIFYLLIVSDAQVKFKVENGFQAGYNCFIDGDCCSKLCLILSNTTFCKCEQLVNSVTSITINHPMTIAHTNSNVDKVEIKRCIPDNAKCVRDIDCCTNKCGRVTGKDFYSCGLEKQPLERYLSPLIIRRLAYCRLSGHYCVADDDCCSKKCVAVPTSPKLHSCISVYG